MEKTKLIISVLTFNHEDFIEECLNSLLNQSTNFPYKIFISDDCSTDGTSKILQKYMALHPDIIFCKIHEKNLGNHKNQLFLYNWVIEANPKYIATIEGDDYWLDNEKLQKQVDFMDLDSNKSVVLTCGNFIEYDNESNVYSDQHYNEFNEFSSLWYELDNKDLLLKWRTKYLTYVIRCNVLKELPLYNYTYIVDFVLIYLIRNKGRVFFLNSILGVYRRHQNGIFGKIEIQKRMKAERKVYLSILKNNIRDNWIQEKLLKTSKKIGKINYYYTIFQINTLKFCRLLKIN